MQAMERHLAAILTTDVVGYSRLMGMDEEGTHLALRVRRIELFDPATLRHRGRVIKLLGDGALIEFTSIVDALSCAIEIQKLNEAENTTLPDDRRIRLRMGINVGDVMLDENDIYGTGVNIAARLQTLATPGGICISGIAVEQVRGLVDAQFHYLGRRELKNIAEPVAVFEVKSGADNVDGQGGQGPERPGRGPGLGSTAKLPADRPSIAVMPFQNMGDGGLQQYFADGITRDLTTELSRFRSLFVIAANSSLRFRDQTQSRSEIGLALGARYLLDGSVQRIGSTLKVNAQLTDTGLGVQIWGERYASSVEDPTAVQERLAHDIAANLNSRLESAELSLSKRKAPTSLRSYDLFLQGAEWHELGGAEGYAKARELYERAIVADPEFARPYASFAELTYMESVLARWGVEDKDDCAEAWALTQRALSLDSQDSGSHAIAAWIHMVRRQFAKADRHWRLAAELNPNDADIMMWRATALAFLGEPERGVAAAEEAMRLNPLHPEWYLSDYAVALFFCRRFEEMLEVYELIPEIYPHTPGWRAAAYAHLGKLAEAQDRAAAFARNIADIWEGPPGAGPRDYGQWFVRCIPLRRDKERDLMVEGLRLAGLHG